MLFDAVIAENARIRAQALRQLRKWNESIGRNWGNVEPLSVTESTLLAAMKTETLSAKPTEEESNWTNLLELWNDRIQKYARFRVFLN